MQEVILIGMLTKLWEFTTLSFKNFDTLLNKSFVDLSWREHKRAMLSTGFVFIKISRNIHQRMIFIYFMNMLKERCL